MNTERSNMPVNADALRYQRLRAPPAQVTGYFHVRQHMITRADEALALAYEFARQTARGRALIDFDAPVRVRFHEDGPQKMEPPYWSIDFELLEPREPDGETVIVSQDGMVQWDPSPRL